MAYVFQTKPLAFFVQILSRQKIRFFTLELADHQLQGFFVSMAAIFVSQARISQTQPYNVAMHPGGRPTKNPRSTLGQRLAEARERAGISQVELAKMLNTNQQTVGYWERKAVSLRSDIVVKLSEILDISADELLGTSKAKPRNSKPSGKAGRLFDAVAKMPRRQQDKIVAVLEPFVNEHRNS